MKHIDSKRYMRLISIIMLIVPNIVLALGLLHSRGLVDFKIPLEYGFLFSIFCTLFLLWWSHTILFRLTIFSKTADALSRSSRVFEPVQNFVDLPDNDKEVQELVSSVETLIEDVHKTRRELLESKSTLCTVLSHIPDIAGNDIDPDIVVKSLLELLTDSCHAHSSCITLVNPLCEYEIQSKIGFEDLPDERILRHARPFLQWIENERKTIVMPRATMKKGAFFRFPLVCVPLIHENHYIGALLLCDSREGQELNNEQLSLVTSICSQIASVFESARFKTNVERVYIDTIASLALSVEERDPYLRGHSCRVQQYATRIGTAMGLTGDSISIIRDAARLHDIGSAGINGAILFKNGPLTIEEHHVVQRHATIGENIVIPLKMYRSLLHPIRHHHERLDGTGYPDGLKGDDISIETRIVSVADIFDALLSDRPYRKGLVLGKAKNELITLAVNGKIDRTVVECLFSLLDQGELELPSAS
ncbi:MAG: HD domain-containing protein [Chitinispirillaceae bacterium]|nr:HD domain-containing protein [Chitinispirillaceae bacterium]